MICALAITDPIAFFLLICFVQSELNACVMQNHVFNPRPASAPSDSRNGSVEPNLAASYHGDFRQWTSTRGRRSDLQSSETNTSFQLRDENQQRNNQRLPIASQPPQDSDGAADGSAANHVSSKFNGTEPWRRKTLLTLGTTFLALVHGGVINS